MKLLKRALKSYLLYSALILLVSVPLFYFITRALCMQDVDEALQDRKTQLTVRLHTNNELLKNLPWHDLNNNTVIHPAIDRKRAEEKVTIQHYSTLSGEKEPFRELHTFVPVNHKVYPVTLRISLIDIEDLIQGTVLTSTLLMILILGGLLWINRRQSKRIWQPFYQTLNQLQLFKPDKKPDLKFIPTDISEFRELQEAILLLTERTYQTFVQQKEFTENAAHELQTPLASIQAKLEVLMQDEHLTKKQSEQVQTLGEVVIRMSRLNKGLLLLAKIENRQFIEKENIQLVPLVKKILQRSQFRIQLKKITVSASYEDYTIEANPMLMDILLSNLINNAIQHAPPDGKIIIDISPRRMDISNGGSPLNFSGEKLFQRFQKGNTTESAGGNGLGLAIVKKICDTFHYTINYKYKNNQHCFTLDFAPDHRDR